MHLPLIDILIISMAVTCVMESEVDLFTVELVIRGYYIYEEVCIFKCNRRSASFLL